MCINSAQFFGKVSSGIPYGTIQQHISVLSGSLAKHKFPKTAENDTVANVNLNG